MRDLQTAALPSLRLRRLREHPILRELVRETRLHMRDFVLPLFITQASHVRKPITAMPGHDQIPVTALQEEIYQLKELGIQAVLLFGIPAHKDGEGRYACEEEGVIQQAIRVIKTCAPEMLVMTDLCFCEYMEHGHCGFIHLGKLENDKTLELLAKQAVSHAQAGADVIAPSGMIDGMVGAVRRGLDEMGYSHLPILSYAVKYHSSLYGPFRMAAEGAPSFGDRSFHQMDYGNAQEALREVDLDVEEGTDMVMVKPAHTYLDIICRVKTRYPMIPLAAYHTSGEFGMIKAAAAQGLVDEKKAVLEILTAIRRAGADFIISYYTKELIQRRWLEE